MRRSTHAVAVTALVGGLLAIAPPASAATFEVDKLTDAAGEACDSAVLNDCSLRSAIQLANANDEADTIQLPAGVYLLTIDGAEDTTAADGATRDLDVTSEILIQGNGATVDATAISDRAFQVTSDGDLTTTGLSVTGGEAQGAPSGTGGASGGAFLNAGILDLTGGELSGNTAIRAGGGIEASAGSTTTLTDVDLVDNSTGNAPGNGGGMHITGAGDATITGGTVTGNTADNEGGGLWNGSGTMTVTDTLVADNTASGVDADSGGGGLYNEGGTVDITGGAVDGNDADGAAGSGGGILNNAGDLRVTGTDILANSAVRAGGGIEAVAGTTTLDDVDLSENETVGPPGNGGGLHLTGEGTVDVVGSFVDDNLAAAEGGGLWNSAGGTMTVTDTSISRNTASGDEATNGGGGLYNDGGDLTVADSTIEDNAADGTAGSGGGILNVSGNLDVTSTDIVGNTAVRAGGGIEAAVAEGGDASATTLTLVDLVGNSTGDSPGNGGGLHITGAGTVDVDRTEVRDNAATNQGGGLWNSAAATMIVTDSTLSGNETGGQGGALYNDGGQLGALNVTVSGNTADDGGGVFGDAEGETDLIHATVTQNSTGVSGTVDLGNSVVAGNTGDDCVGGSVTSSGGNVTGDSCDIDGPGDRTDVADPQLGELADNGGPTLTQLPAAGSPVIDAAGADLSTGADQRGAARPQDGDGNGSALPDAGAVEVAAVADDDDDDDGAGGGVPTSPPATPVPAQPSFTG